MKTKSILTQALFLALIMAAWSSAAAGTLTIGSNTQLDRIDIENGATVDVNAHTLTLGTGGVDIKTGATLLGDGTINNAGAWTTAGTFTHENGTVAFNGAATQAITNATTFYNLTIANTAATPSADADVEPTAAITVANTLSIEDGRFSPYTGSVFKDVSIANANGYLVPAGDLSVSGNWANSGVFTAGSGTVTFNGTSLLNAGGTGATRIFNNVILNGTGVTLSGDAVKIGGTLILTAGTWSLDSQDMEVTGAYSCEDNAILQLKGSETVVLTAGMDVDTGRLAYSSPAADVDVLKSPFTTVHDLTLNDGGGTARTFTLGADAVVNGLLSVTDGTLALSDKSLALNEGMTIAAAGTVTGGSNTVTLADGKTITNNGAWNTAGTGTFSCIGSAAFAGSSGITFYNLNAGPATGETLTFADGITYTVDGLLTLTGAGSGSNLLNIVKSGGGANAVLSKNAGSDVAYVAVDGVNGVDSKIITASNSYAAGNTPLYWQFGTESASGGGDWDTAATWASGHVPDSADDVTIADNVNLNTDATVNSLSVTANTLSLFDGDTPHTLTVTDTATVGGVVDVGIGTMTVSAASEVTGTLTIGTGTYTANGAFDASAGSVTFSGSGTLNLAGSVGCNALGTFSAASGSTVDYKLDGDQAVDDGSYHHLVLSSGGSKSLCGSIDVNGNLTNSTILDVADASYAIDIAGNWSNSGTFTHADGTVTFDGSQDATLVPGNSAFYALVLNKASSGALLSPKTSATLTVSNALTVTTGTFNLVNGDAATADVDLSLGNSLSIGENGLWRKSNDTTPKTVTFTGDNCTLSDTTGVQNLGHVIVQ